MICMIFQIFSWNLSVALFDSFFNVCVHSFEYVIFSIIFGITHYMSLALMMPNGLAWCTQVCWPTFLWLPKWDSHVGKWVWISENWVNWEHDHHTVHWGLHPILRPTQIAIGMIPEDSTCHMAHNVLTTPLASGINPMAERFRSWWRQPHVGHCVGG